MSGVGGESKKTGKAAERSNKGCTYSLLAYPLNNAFFYVQHDVLLLSAAMGGRMAEKESKPLNPGTKRTRNCRPWLNVSNCRALKQRNPVGRNAQTPHWKMPLKLTGNGKQLDISAVPVDQEAEEEKSTVRPKKQSLSQKKLLFNAVQEDAKTAIEESIKSLSAWLKDTELRSNTTLDALGTFPHAIGKKTGTYSSEVHQLFCFCVGRPRKALNAKKCKVLGIRNVKTFDQIQNQANYLVRDLKGPGILNQVHAICESEIDAASSRFDVKINVITLSVF